MKLFDVNIRTTLKSQRVAVAAPSCVELLNTLREVISGGDEPEELLHFAVNGERECLSNEIDLWLHLDMATGEHEWLSKAIPAYDLD